MNPSTKKLFWGLAILALLSPLGIVLPDAFKAEEAWGEWDVKTVEKQTGQSPAGMKKDAELWKAPMPDYGTGKQTNDIGKRSAFYILSAISGLAIIALITIGSQKIFTKK